MRKYTPKPGIITKWQLATFLFRTGFCLWIVETIYFMYRDGLHWKAIYADEKLWDTIAMCFLQVGFLFFVTVLYDIVIAHVNAVKVQWEKQKQEDDDSDNESYRTV